MKKRNSHYRRSVLSATTAALFLLTNVGSALAQKIGTPYGSREPRICADITKPSKGPISAAQAKQYLICGMERVYMQRLYLLEDLSVTVGGGVPYNPKTYPYATDIDVTYPTYPIRASYKQYSCGVISDDAGKNCTLYVVKNATGVCYRTTFGDWSCSATSFDGTKPQYYVAPPQ